ncbi:putative COP9 signalosome complex subunit 12 [Triangularia verruculosa]|uniref:Protein CSN12 homolog n=1 Tax=Triangularia verruculosa TaxID=2587418 RepID=A0AAN6XB84_9PEZI|nr:putative COP9 signalosome complex subunit 12 [Triangularia verruculosa]
MEFGPALYHEFGEAWKTQDGYRLAKTISPDLPPGQLSSIFQSINIAGGWKSARDDDVKAAIKRGLSSSSARSDGIGQKEIKGWVEVYFAYWQATGILAEVQQTSSWTNAYEQWKVLINALIQGYNGHEFEAWTIPCLYVAGKHLRLFAMKADENTSVNDNSAAAFQDDFDPELQKHQKLEDCARVLNRVFSLCLSDRAPLEESRKWGLYYIINLLFKTYFKLNATGLSKNVLRILTAGRGDMPDFHTFPKSQQVTFKYHEGVLCFLEENYAEAEKHLTEAWNTCHKDAMRNKELILTYLIPCHLITTHTLPTEKLLEPYPRLQKLFLPLCQCIKKGELHKFDLALQEAEDEFVKRRIYLTLERGRDIALRNLLRKVFIAGGFEPVAKEGDKPVRRTRVPVAEFAAAISLGSEEKVDNDEVECLLANMIYKGLVKGYISRERSIVVLSKSGAFPGTGV